MKRLIFSVLVLTGVTVAEAVEFAAPVRLSGGGQAVRVESPGYAAPCWADVDGDGKKDLLVGQFNNGKIRVYRNLTPSRLIVPRFKTPRLPKSYPPPPSRLSFQV